MILILAYHHIAEQAPEKKTNMFVSSDAFYAQMSVLAGEYGSSMLCNLDKLPDSGKHVVVTFDDGYQNFLSLAFPILSAFRLAATLFVPTGLIGTKGLDPEQGRVVEYLTRPNIEFLEKSGLVDIQCHGHNHIRFGEMSDKAQRHDIGTSLLALQDIVKKTPRHFCYPYGSFNDATIQTLRDFKMETACTTVTGSNALPVVDPLKMKRVPVHSLMDKALFRQTLKTYLGG